MPVPQSSAEPQAILGVPDDTGGGGVYLAAEPNLRFHLTAHPLGWEWCDKEDGSGAFLPALSRQDWRPGSNGIRTLGQGESEDLVYKECLRIAKDRGHVVLSWRDPVPAEFLPTGALEGGYRRQFPCQGPKTKKVGTFYAEVWSIPLPRLQGMPQRYRFDRERFDGWRRHLVTSGVVQDIPEEIRAIKIAEVQAARTHIERIHGLTDADREKRLAVVTARLAAMRGDTPATKPADTATKARGGRS